MEGSISERSVITEASVGFCNDFSDLSHSIQDLQLGKETSTSSSSSSLSQTQKDEQAVTPEDMWAYHTHINAGTCYTTIFFYPIINKAMLRSIGCGVCYDRCGEWYGVYVKNSEK